MPVATDQQRCGSGSIDLLAQSDSGLYWYDAPLQGNLLATGNMLSIQQLSLSNTYYVSAGEICISPAIPVTAIILPFSTAPIIASQENCGSGAFQFQVNTSDSLSWYDATGNLLYSGALFQTGVLNQSASYFVQAGLTCPSTPVAFDAIIHPVHPVPTVNDVVRCGPGTITFSVNDTSLLLWRDALKGNLLGTGSSFTTDYLFESQALTLVAGLQCPSAPVQVNAIVHELPQLNLGNDTVLSPGNSLVLDAGAGFNAYYWSTQQTTSSIQVSSAGTYMVTVMNHHGCENSDTITISILTDMDPITPALRTAVYPNPTSGVITVTVPGKDKINSYAVYDASGRRILYEAVDSVQRSILIGLSAFPAGTYWFELSTDKSVLREKIMVIH